MAKYAYGPADKPPVTDEMKSVYFAICAMGVILFTVVGCICLSLYT